MTPLRPSPFLYYAAALVFCSITLPGCHDRAKESAAHAEQDVAQLTTLVRKDVGEVERGLPQGSKRLSKLLEGNTDPKQDVARVRRALLRVRREVPDLEIAKSTFFALADPSGIAIRNDLEEDVMAGQNLVSIFPALAAARDKYVTTTGTFPTAGSKRKPDKDWVAGVPVKRADGSTGALFVTGWTYRYFARHLQESLKDRLTEQAKTAHREGEVPVFYVAVFDGSGVYSAPLTPPVDDEALAAQDLVAKTAHGPAKGTLSITDRAFGWAAERTPDLAPGTGVAVLRSEL